jgi:hypothetical protein
MTELAVTEALGESLSPSQVTAYLTYPAKGYFRYLVSLSELATGALHWARRSTRHQLPAEDEHRLLHGGLASWPRSSTGSG